MYCGKMLLKHKCRPVRGAEIHSCYLSMLLKHLLIIDLALIVFVKINKYSIPCYQLC